jgi:hypothetical protein
MYTREDLIESLELFNNLFEDTDRYRLYSDEYCRILDRLDEVEAHINALVKIFPLTDEEKANVNPYIDFS